MYTLDWKKNKEIGDALLDHANDPRQKELKQYAQGKAASEANGGAEATVRIREEDQG